MGFVDGIAAAPDVRGIIQGNGGAVDKVAGSSGKDMLEGHATFNQYYGGAGSDTFIFNAKFAEETVTVTKAYSELSAYVTDFQGAGGWSATNNDFINFTGFGATSTLELLGEGTSGTVGAKIFYYAIHDSATGGYYNFSINSLNGHALGAGDYAFYSPVPDQVLV